MPELVKILEDGLGAVKKQINTEIGKLEAKNKQLSDEIAELAQKQCSYPDGNYTRSAQKSGADFLLKSSELQNLREGRTKSAIIPANMALKSLLVGDVGSSTSDLYSAMPARGPEAVYGVARRRLSLLDALPTVQVGSGTFEFVQIGSTFENTAGYQTEEGAAKPAQDLPTTLVSRSIATIAAVMAASEQVLADSPALLQFIQGQLFHGLRDKLERELIGGAGGTGAVSGLLTEAVEFVASDPSSLSQADKIGEAASALDATGWQASHAILNPGDWQQIRAERTTDFAYVSNGWNQPDRPNIWGLDLIVSSGIPQGSAIVLDSTQVAILDRQQAAFELGRIDDDFSRNIVRARAELRAGLAVFASGAVLKLSI